MRYVVTGPEVARQEWGPCYPDSGGPVVDERDVFLVDAPTASKAKWAAFKHPKSWRRDIGNDEHPLTGVTVERAAPDDSPEVWGDLYIDAEEA